MIFITSESHEVGPPGLGLTLTDVPANLDTSIIKGREKQLQESGGLRDVVSCVLVN